MVPRRLIPGTLEAAGPAAGSENVAGAVSTALGDTIVQAKGGNPESVVVLSIAHTEDDTCSRTGHATQADTLLRFTRRFEHGLTESICATSFEGPFERATDVIQGACGE